MKNQTIVLNMNKQQAYNLIKQMTKNIQNETNIPVVLDKNRKAKTGFITNPQTQNQPQSIILGCQNIKTILKRKEPVNTNDFIGCIIAGYHEQQHLLFISRFIEHNRIHQTITKIILDTIAVITYQCVSFVDIT